MAFVPTTDGARVWCKLAWGDVEFGNVLWFSQTDFDYDDMLNLANTCLTQYKSVLTGSYHDEITIGPFLCYDMRTIGGIVVPSNVATGAGTNASDPLPLGDCVVVTHRTLNRGRAYRGRSYLSGFVEGDLSDGKFTAALGAGIATMFADIRMAALTWGWTFGVRSGQLEGVPRNPAVITPIVLSEVRNLIPGTQKARNDRP